MEQLNNENKYHLIAKYLLGEATNNEIISVENWINLNAENKKEFELIKNTFEHFPNESNINVDTDSAWLTVKSKLEKPKSTPVLWKKFAYAASIVFVIGIVGIIIINQYNKTKIMKTVFKTKKDENKTIYLSDSSEIKLGANSEIVYSNFSRNSRQIQFKGKAEFSITSDSLNPFKIAVANGEIAILGTHFMLEDTNDSTLHINLFEGKIKYSNNLYTNKILATGDNIIINTKTGKIIEQKKNYTNKILTFEETPLTVAFRELEKSLFIKIVCNENLKNCPLNYTVDIVKSKPEKILQTICNSMSLRYEPIAGARNAYLIHGNICN